MSASHSFVTFEVLISIHYHMNLYSVSLVSHFIHWISMDQHLGRSTTSPALWALAKGAWPYMPTLYVLYLTMSPLIAIACLVFNIVAVLYIKYRHLLMRH